MFELLILKCFSLFHVVQHSLEAEKTWLQCQCERWGLREYLLQLTVYYAKFYY